MHGSGKFSRVSHLISSDSQPGARQFAQLSNICSVSVSSGISFDFAHRYAENSPSSEGLFSMYQISGCFNVDFNNAGYALLLHGDADELFGDFHRDFIMGNEDELRLRRHFT